ncbi:MAG: aminotransferase class I/II-fold pyridoxal phosphate-dependent enzyme [Candidatus Eisenbacteria bacterium]|nr:aminotransferase class I/II-fold pyridoxal phosphate-dependent enzyme [Candidatus Eisenbacteria bacterium]
MSHDSERPAHAIETNAVHGPHTEHRGPVSTPIVHSATFTFEKLEDMVEQQRLDTAGSFYQRKGHPTIFATEERLALLEGCEAALLFPSGMAAISTVFLTLLRTGEHLVCVDPCYGGTQALLAWGREHFGWEYTLVDARRPDTWEAAFQPNTRVLHLESPINPTLAVLDVEAAAAMGKRHGCVVTIDNTIASPLGQRPLEMGCDISLYSATKSIGGHSDLLAGAAMGSWKHLRAAAFTRLVFGPIADPAMAWMIERSLKTMPLRVRAGNANAMELATRLTKHPKVAQVFYPGLPSHPTHALAVKQMREGFGPLLSFEVTGGAEAALAVVNKLKVIKHGASLGGVESLASLAAFTSHQILGPEGRARAGIPEGLVRVSAGVEHVEDLWADLVQALG